MAKEKGEVNILEISSACSQYYKKISDPLLINFIWSNVANRVMESFQQTKSVYYD